MSPDLLCGNTPVFCVQINFDTREGDERTIVWQHGTKEFWRQNSMDILACTGNWNKAAATE